LLWSAEQGTDGHIPTRYVRALHPDGEKLDAAREVAQAGIWEINPDGIQFIDWSGRLGQSTALEVETAKASARDRQKRWRERERQKTANAIGFVDQTPQSLRELGETRDVTRYETRPDTGDVGTGTGTGKGQVLQGDSHEISATETGEVLDWPVTEIPDSEWGDPSAPGNVSAGRTS
jgi:hypothetical protein